MPEAQDRWDSCAESARWQSGDPLVIFAYKAFKNDEEMMLQPNAVINPARNDIETNLQASRSFFPFQDVLTYTVVQIKPGPRNSSDPYSMVELSDGSVWYENQYEGMRRYKLFPKLKVGDKIALRQYDNYRWRGSSHSISQFMSFTAIRVETGEEIDLLDLGDRKRQPQGQSCKSTKSRLQLLIGGKTLIEVADEATYKKVLSWGPKAKVTIALANHLDGYILVNLTAFQRTFWPLYHETYDHWVPITVLVI